MTVCEFEIGDEPLWEPDETAAFLRVSLGWLERDRASGEPKIPYVKLGRLCRYVPPMVRAAAKRHTIGAA